MADANRENVQKKRKTTTKESIASKCQKLTDFFTVIPSKNTLPITTSVSTGAGKN